MGQEKLTIRARVGCASAIHVGGFSIRGAEECRSVDWERGRNRKLKEDSVQMENMLPQPETILSRLVTLHGNRRCGIDTPEMQATAETLHITVIEKRRSYLVKFVASLLVLFRCRAGPPRHCFHGIALRKANARNRANTPVRQY